MITGMNKMAVSCGLPIAAMTLVAAIAATGLAATPGELLQKAIYTEETVGNLDEAMKLYEQVIADAKTGQEAAAQAQFRLGLCHLKKGDESAARQAFETLINDYPNAKDLIAQARKYVPSGLELLPAPWTNGERLQLNMKLPTGVDIGTMIYMVDAGEYDGKEILRCSTRGLVTVSDANSYSDVFCDPVSFAPIKSHWKNSFMGEANAIYSDNSATITIPNGKNKPFTIPFTPPAFDNEQCVELFRRLPLSVGYKTTLSVITSLGGNNIRIPVSVSATESITVPAGTFECYKLDLGLVNQTFWISNNEHRYVVRFAAGGVTADLVHVWQADRELAEKVSGDGFSFTLPASWFAYKPTKTLNDKAGTEVFLLDPTAAALGQVEVLPKDSLTPEQRESPKAWAESVNHDFKNIYRDFTIREPAFRDVEVDGKRATVIVADLSHKGSKKTLYSMTVMGDESAVAFRLMAENDKFDELLKSFDKIVESFEFK